MANDCLLLEDGSGVLLHENGDRMLLEDGVPFRPFIGAEPFTVTLSLAPVGKLQGRVVRAEAFAVQISIIDLNLFRNFSVGADPFQLTVTWAPSALLSGRAVIGEPFSLTTAWAEAQVLRGAAVGADRFRVDLLLAEVPLTRGYIFYVDPFALQLGWGDSELLRHAVIAGEEFDLKLDFTVDAKVTRIRSEIGWGSALYPPLDACRAPLSDAVHTIGETGEFGRTKLHPPVQGGRIRLSDAVHPRGTVAQPFPLKRKDC